jgi:hypothetical protein
MDGHSSWGVEHMKFQERRIDLYLETVWAIASSPACSGYVVGYTAQQLWRRADGYKQLGYQHMAILEDK